MNSIGLIGCGNLGMSIVQGIRSEFPEIKIVASKRNLDEVPTNLAEFTSDNAYLIEQSEVIVLALKPYAVESFLKEFGHLLNPERHTLISVVTGVTIEEIANNVTKGVGIYRAMPNTATSVNESITAISVKNDPLNREAVVLELFRSLGDVVKINEDLMESATILGACGIAYVLRFMRAMIQGGIEVGFDSKTATRIVSQTIKGAAQLIIQHNSHPEEEIDKVTTPKGCTIVGLNEMEHAGFSSSLIKGIVSSYKKIER